MQDSLVFLILGVGRLREDQFISVETRETVFFYDMGPLKHRGLFTQVDAYKSASQTMYALLWTQKAYPSVIHKLRAEGSAASTRMHTSTEQGDKVCANDWTEPLGDTTQPYPCYRGELYDCYIFLPKTTSAACLPACLPACWRIQRESATHSALQPVANCEDAKLLCGIQTPPSYGLVNVAARINATCF